MGKELVEVIEENGIVYRLAENGCYYPDLRLSEGTFLDACIVSCLLIREKGDTI